MAKPNDAKRKRNRKNIIEYWGYCIWCGSRDNLTIDHIIPLSKGGSHHFSNLQCLCHSCNAWKADRYEEECEALNLVGHCIVAIIKAIENAKQ